MIPMRSGGVPCCQAKELRDAPVSEQGMVHVPDLCKADDAFAMLSPISYLSQALDIPYCHHEKWDGSGYPRGLMGEQIPLLARIFAVVDVWDALRFDRPYRKGMAEAQALEYIVSNAGAHFDPQVVEAFLQLERR